VAIVGASGQLGSELVVRFQSAGHDVLPLARPELDLERPESLDVVPSWRPDVVVNAAAWTDVDGCALDPERAMRLNGEAAGRVAAVAASTGALVVQVSTNEVFDGSEDRPYRETDEPGPINPYGSSKLAGERAVAAANARHVIVRTAWLFSLGQRTFPARIRAAARRAEAAGQALRVVADEFGNPTWTPDLAAVIVRISGIALATGVPSILHAAGWPPASRFEWAEAALADMRDLRIEPIRLSDYSRPSRVPPRAVLDVARARGLGIEPSDWRGATAALVGDEARTNA